MKTVAEVMTTNPTKVSRHASASDVAKLMREDDIGAVPVVEDGRLVGIVTDRDLALRVVAAGRNPNTTCAEEIATTEPRAADRGESLDEAYVRMATWRVRRLPVVDGERLVGMLTQADLVHEVKDKRAGQLVDQISQPGQYVYGRRREVGLR
jgi:CBS domain-containing protein